MRYPILLLTFLFSITVFGQKKTASINGKVIDEEERPMSGVSIIILGQQKGLVTDQDGKFSLTVPANRAFALVFSYTNYRSSQQNYLLNEGESETVTVRLERSTTVMEEIVVKDQRDRTETGLIRPNPKSVINLPSPIMGVEGLLKVFVGSNNELTSQYNVRGGSYDENLIYVNDFEIFRPYLVRSGQQEGLSFINPELVKNISFYNGGFQAKYGDKMSSVLDIQYNTPTKFAGSAYLSILEQGAHVEGISTDKKFTFVLGARNRSNRNLFSRQETQGSYIPSSSDFQGLLTYKHNRKWQSELLGNLSRTKFSLTPEFSQLTSSVFSPFFTSNIGVDIFFDGREKDQYFTGMLGLATTYQPTKDLKLKWLASRFENNEEENVDIAGAYLFGDRDFDKSSATFGLIVNPLGAGVNLNYARNRLNIVNYNISHKGSLLKSKQLIQWGLSYDQTSIDDRLNEWELQDSAGYSLPYNPSQLGLYRVVKSSADLLIHKFSGYAQDNFTWRRGGNVYTLQGGMRFNYNSLNQQLLFSPRLTGSWKPLWKKDVVLRAALGSYDQPPFYRELRRYDGTVNTQLKAQRSQQAVLGLDYNFVGLNRPLRLTAEAFYKNQQSVVPYDIDNVRLRYFGENSARAYAAGLELRLFGELVKDAESWLSFSVMKTKENIKNDFFTVYKTGADLQPVDSSVVEGGWFRRPTDRLLTVGMFFQDYLSTNKNFKVYINGNYGTNLPYNIPGSVRYRNALTIPPYIRIDIGFSALLLDNDRSNRRSHSPFRNFDNIWASFEVFNLIDRDNTISYLLIKDFSNNVFTLPNRLTPRLVNLKLVARW